MSKQILYQIQSPIHLSTKTGKRPTVIVPKLCKSSFMITIKTEFNYCFYTQDIYIPKSHNTAFRIDIIQDFKSVPPDKKIEFSKILGRLILQCTRISKLKCMKNLKAKKNIIPRKNHDLVQSTVT